MAVRNIRKQLAGVEDLLLGKGKQDQERSAGIVSITKIDIPAIVETIDELSLVDINKYTTAIVKDLDRGGTFIYDSTKVAENNQVTIFNGWTRQYATDFGTLRPLTDNTYNIGEPLLRWSVVYAGTGTINTSDAREKTFGDIPEVEKQVAIELKGLMKRFKFNNAIETKGIDNARIHYGTSAQEVISVFEKYDLDAMQYGMVCYDEWEDELDGDGNIIVKAGNRYGIRYEELLCFIISAM